MNYSLKFKNPLLMLILVVTSTTVFAQKKSTDSKEPTVITTESLDHKIDALLLRKQLEVNAEKEALKKIIIDIDTKLKKGEITSEDASKLKDAAALISAKNIADKTKIIDLKIDLLKRNKGSVVSIDSINQIKSIGISINKNGKPWELDEENGGNYRNRKNSDLVFAFGFNNLIATGERIKSREDLDFELFKSRFFEIGKVWRTDFSENGLMRLSYGFNFQFNGLTSKQNNYIVANEGYNQIVEHDYKLIKSKFRTDNLIFPVHLEIGRAKKIERLNTSHYSLYESLRFGFGAYAGFNLGSRQKLIYNLDTNRNKKTLKSDYNVSDFIYGLSFYAGKGGTQFYAKYDLTSTFDKGTIYGNNLSLGVRVDL